MFPLSSPLTHRIVGIRGAGGGGLRNGSKKGVEGGGVEMGFLETGPGEQPSGGRTVSNIINIEREQASSSRGPQPGALQQGSASRGPPAGAFSAEALQQDP
jgi:hypothetical protein